MKKKIVLISSALLSIAVAICVTIQSIPTSSSSLLLMNIEALSAGESDVSIPCSAEKKSKCPFTATDASGQTHSYTWKDYKKV